MLRTLLIIILFATHAYAQVNTEKYRAREDFRGFTGYFELSGTFKTGNTEETEADLDARLDWKLDVMDNFVIFQSESEWIDGQRFTNELLVHMRNVIHLTPKLRTEIFVQTNFDKTVLINNRELFGAGLRYKVFDFDEAYISLGTAYMFEHENYDLPSNAIHPNDVKVFRWSNYVSSLIRLKNGIEISSVVYYQPIPDNFSDVRVLNESNLNVSLASFLSLTVNFKVRYDSEPPDGIKDTDTKTNLGFMVKI